VIRVLGGALYLFGMLVMLWNVLMTVFKGRATPILIPTLNVNASH